jgi:cell wall-associated NlpC family hydrolase
METTRFNRTASQKGMLMVDSRAHQPRKDHGFIGWSEFSLRFFLKSVRPSSLNNIGPSRGFVTVRVSMVLVALMAVFELGVGGAAGLLSGTNEFRDIRPTTSPFKPMTAALPFVGPEAPKPAVARLMEVAHKMAARTNVPYVFGGHAIGKSKVCQECTDCIRKNHLSANSTRMRYNQCASCRHCGIDCSSFVNRIFAEAGLRYRFADTQTLRHTKDGFLEEQYGFVNVGSDLMKARPGDLLLEKGHIVMVVDVDLSAGTIDYIHASRGSKRTPEGGIELRRGDSVVKLQKTLVRILRHRELITPDDDIIVGSRLSVWSKFRRLMASNS